MKIRDFIKWVRSTSIKKFTKASLIEYTAQQLGVSPEEVISWQKGKSEPNQTVQILMKVLMHRGHFIEKPDLSGSPESTQITRQYVSLIYWSDEDQAYLGCIPDLCGNCCHGKTIEEIGIHLEEILELCAETFIEDKHPLPQQSPQFDMGKIRNPSLQD